MPSSSPSKTNPPPRRSPGTSGRRTDLGTPTTLYTDTRMTNEQRFHAVMLIIATLIFIGVIQFLKTP